VRAQVSPDPFARLARRPQALLQRAVDEARLLLRGSTVQARCLECPPAYDWVAEPDGAGSWWLALLARSRTP
jgi:hypothetical protein